MGKQSVEQGIIKHRQLTEQIEDIAKKLQKSDDNLLSQCEFLLFLYNR